MGDDNAHTPQAEKLDAGDEKGTRRDGFWHLRAVGFTSLAIVLYFILADTAVETLISGSPVRWWVAVIVVIYFAALAVLWWRSQPLWQRLNWEVRATTSLFVFLGLLTITVWIPGGIANGVRLLGQATSTLLIIITAIAIALSGVMLMRPRYPHPAVKWAIVVLTTYGGIAFLWAIFAGISYPALFRGQSFWTWLPTWFQGAFIGALVIVPLALVFEIGTRLRLFRQSVSRTFGFQQMVVSATVLAIVVAAVRVPAGWVISPGQVSDRGPGTTRQDLGALQLPVPRTFGLTHVDPAHFAAALGNDPARIFNFVRDNIAFEVYTGVLRGPRGTLMAMAGNSVDRAALLAAMLEHASQRIRYVRGTLGERETGQLVTSMWAGRRRPAQAKGHPSPAAQLALDTLTTGIKRDYQLVRDRLKSAGIPAREPPPTFDSLEKESAVHYWIQWAKNGTWVDLDPSFGDAVPGRAYARAENTFETLPNALFHRVTIRIRLEEYTGDTPSSREILSYTTRAADLSGVDMVLGHQPENWKGPVASLRRALSSAIEDTGRAKPVLVVGGKNWVTGEPFRQRRPTGKGIGGIQDLLAGTGTRTPTPIATAESIEFDFGGTDGRNETAIREIFDLVGQARRAVGKNLSADEVYSRTEDKTAVNVTDTIYDLFFTTGRLDPDHLRGVARRGLENSEPLDLGTLMKYINLSLVAISDGLLGDSGNVIFYPDSPRVVVTEISATSGSHRLGIDLRRDSVRAVAGGVQPQQTFFARVFRGVVDGTLERVVAGLVTHEPGGRSAWPITMSTSSLFEQARVTRTPMRLLTPRDMSFDGGLPENTLARLRDDLVHGYLILAPERAITLGGTPRFAWWRIDGRSGDTIAMTDEGLHAATEYEYIEEADSTVMRPGNTILVTKSGLPAAEIFDFYKGVEDLGTIVQDILADTRGGDFILHLHPYIP